MKDSLLVPVRYLFRGILFFMAIGIVAAFHTHALSAGRVRILEAFFLTLINAGPELGFFSLFFALLVSHFSILRRPGLRVLSLALLFLVAAASTYIGLFWLSRLHTGSLSGEIPLSSPPRAESLYKADGLYIWMGDTQSTPVRSILVADPEGPAERFHLYPEGIFSSEKDELRILKTGQTISLSPKKAERRPWFIGSLFRDMTYIAGLATPKRFFDLEAGLFVLALTFFGFSLWTFARFSRWPLFNMWIVFGTAWLTLAGVRFIGTVLVPELQRLGPLVAFLPAAFPGVFGLILFLGGLLLPPLGEWQRNLRYG